MDEVFRFALLSDSCLTDNDIASEIYEADKNGHRFDCVVHLGNIINLSLIHI